MAAASPGKVKHWLVTRGRLSAALLLLSVCMIYIYISGLNVFLREETANGNKEDPLAEQAARKRLLDNMCARTSQDLSSKSWDRFFVIPADNVMFCLIRKVGSNLFKALLTRLSRRCNVTRNSSQCQVKTLDFFSESERNDVLNSYTKVMFVRDPLERLWSVYNNHLASFNPRWAWEFGVEIIKSIRYNGSSSDEVCGNDVTFQEFLEYVVRTAAERNNFNPHWQPYYSICDPCNVRYDFIGKLEAFDKDATGLSQLFPVQFPKHLTGISTKAGKLNAITRIPFLENGRSRYLKKLPKRCSSVRLYLEARRKALHHLGINISSPDVLLPNTTELSNSTAMSTYIKAKITKEIANIDMKQVRSLRNSRLHEAFCSLERGLKRKLINLYNTDTALFGYTFPDCGHYN